MLGKSVPNGNGRLALALVDALVQKLMASGVMSEADIGELTQNVEARLQAEHSIASEGALSVLHSSQIGR